MSTIFISHSSKDNEFAKELERQLNKQNHSSVFLDFDPEKGIVGGQSWEQTLYRKLRACRAVIAICTDDYLSSQWCFAEIALARMEGKPIFALKVEGLSPDARMPSILSENQYIKMHPNPEEGWQRLWNGLREMDLLGLVGEWNPNDPPYLGLNAFDEKQAPVFFGREDESRNGVELLERGSPNLIMTLGASGCGKSSLVKAGILPRLRQDPDRWLIVEPFRPGSNPYRELAEAFVDTFKRYAPDHVDKLGGAEALAERLELSATEHDANEQLDQGFVNDIADDKRVQRLINQLEELSNEPPDNAHGKFLQFLDWSVQDLKRICENPEQGYGFNLNISSSIVVDLAEELRRASGKSHARVLIVIDQFEELLSRKKAKKIMNSFLRLMRHSIEAEHTPLMVLGTMRSDFLGQFQHNDELRGIDFESLSIGPMTVDGVRRVIEAPARLAALELEEGLADRLIEDTGNTTALPLLSFTLWKLWRDFRDDGLIEVKEYETLGGLDGAIASEANALVSSGKETQIRNAFLQMVRLTDEGQYARRQVKWDSEELKPVHQELEKFVEQRLLVIREQAGEKIVEVAHESLFKAWKPLSRWLDAHRADLVLKKDLTREAKTWEEAGKPKDNLWRGTRLQLADHLLKAGQLNDQEKSFVKAGGRSRRIQRLTGVGTAVLVFIGMAFFAAKSWIAEDKALEAQEQALIAQDEAEDAYANMIETVISVAHKLLPGGSQAGQVVADGTLLDIEGKETKEQLVVRGHYGLGKVMAVAHGGAISSATSEGELFIGPALAWTGLYHVDPKVYYSVGHCEIVTDSEFNEFSLPLEAIRSWEYQIEPMANLLDLSALDPISEEVILIIGNAWSAFSEEEINAVADFVNEGGGLLMAGLAWSWRDFSGVPQEFNPCTFNAHDNPEIPSTDVYPMNALGAAFGIKWNN